MTQALHLAAALDRYRLEPTVRASIVNDCDAALRGFASGKDPAWHEADWLRSQAYLRSGLPHLEEAGSVERARVLTTQPQNVAAFDVLWGRLQPALDALGRLHALEGRLPVDHTTPEGIAAYWGACSETAPRMTIDWASFDRDDLFDENGRRAAAWLFSAGGVESRHSILQVGCGMGRVERHLAGRVAKVIGIDVSREMIERARVHLAGAPVLLQHSDGVSTGLPDAFVDYAFALLVFIHVHAPATRLALLRDVHRTLKPHGRFWLTLDLHRISEEGGVEAVDRTLREAAHAAGFGAVRRSRVDSRAINSFSFEWDWRWELLK